MSAQPDDVDPYAFRAWTPQAQQRALERLREMQAVTWKPFYCTKPMCDGKPHDDWKWPHARADQHPPKDPDWLTWASISGRGSGKTRQGSEFTHRMTEQVERMVLVGATSGDIREVLVEGESGLIATAAPGKRPHFEPSKRRLTWPNGCQALLISAEEPDRLRGPQSSYAWIDEAAHMPLIEEVWSNLLFGLRLGKRPRIIVTTTPKPRKWLKDLMAEPRTRISRASTYSNLDNLAPTFAEQIINRYEGTRIGRQELHGEFLEDVEGALWSWDLIEAARAVAAPDDLQRVVVGVDPAGSSKDRSDETGIIIAGSKGRDVYVLADRSGRYTPLGWANAVKQAYEEFKADAVVVEKNYGGEMVEHTLRTSGIVARIINVDARRSKSLRAEPVVGLFEQHLVHLCGDFPELETQLAEWIPYESSSPDRLDAMVYSITHLSKGQAPAGIASPANLGRR